MTLVDLRKLAIRRQTRIRFALRNGMECVITEQGVAQVPLLKGPPDFNLEEELVKVSQFVLDPVIAVKKPGSKDAPLTTTIEREALSAMAGSGGAAPAAEHDDE